MNKKLVGLIGVLSLAAALVIPAAFHAQPNPAQPAGAHPAAPAGPAAAAAPMPPEEHPEIREAIRALENAKGHLERGAKDFGGHRVKALEFTNHALEECHEALQADRH